MTKELRLIKGGPDEKSSVSLDPEERLRVFRRMAATMARDALNAWSDVYREFEGKVTSGTMITGEARKGFRPGCGWPEFLERMWLLEHHLDHLKRICDGGA